MQWRPFTLLGSYAHGAVHNAMAVAVDEWCQAYAPHVATDAVGPVAAHSPSGAITACWRDGKRVLWVGWDHRFVPNLRAALFGTSGGEPAPMATDVTMAVLSALVARLGATLLPANAEYPRAGAEAPAEAVDAHELLTASGAACCAVHLGDAKLTCVVSAAAVEALAPARTVPAQPKLAVVDWRQALANVPISLAIEAGRAQVGAGSLLHCGPGDVIRLDSRADQPLSVCAPGGSRLFYGFLGRVGDATAVEVTQHF